MISSAMFLTTAIFAFSTFSLYPEWTWLPQTPKQAIIEGITVVMMFASAIMLKMEEFEKKLDARK